MAKGCWLPWLLPLLVFLSLLPCDGSSGDRLDPTAGFAAVELTEDMFKLHKPYDLLPEQRYEFHGGVRRMWVLCTDRPFSHGSTTKPRSEILLNVFGASGRNTTLMLVATLMLHVYGGRLMYYHDEARVVDGDIYSRWFRLNVVHDVDAGTLAVFVDGEERLTIAGHGGHKHYFKFGVYAQADPSHCMESRWRDIKVYTKIVD